MRNTKFTKQEWIADGTTVYSLHESGKYKNGVPEMCNRFYLTVYPDYQRNVSLEEVEANAKLIAAAPELLENLIRLVDRIEENEMGNMSAVKRAKEAINKATE